MTDDEAKTMLDQLAKHFGEPVMPVSRYCDSLHQWADRMARKHDIKSDYVRWLNRIRIDVTKSNLLARLIYGGEKPRTKRCPVHDGKWDGQAMLNGCEHECDGTGWLRGPEDAK